MAQTEPIRRPSVSVEDSDHEQRWERGDEETDARTLGTLCHDILATVDLAKPPEVDGEAGRILNPFFRTDAFREIAGAERVEREIPFVVERQGEIWSGQIDVLFRTGGRWIVADYKSDREEDPGKYESQAQVYTEVAQRVLSLPEPPEFRMIYLRSGNVVSSKR